MNKKLILKLFLIAFIFFIAISYVHTFIVIKKGAKVQKEVVEQYCHIVHRYSVDEYLTCKDKDALEILIDLSDEAENRISKVPKKELIEATKSDK